MLASHEMFFMHINDKSKNTKKRESERVQRKRETDI